MRCSASPTTEENKMTTKWMAILALVAMAGSAVATEQSSKGPRGEMMGKKCVKPSFLKSRVGAKVQMGKGDKAAACGACCKEK
jgi:hypothetical protein